MMEFFSQPVVAVVILLGVLVLVHESGHFIVGKLSGIAVEIFSIGFGPTIFSFQRNETNYRISCIPLGGYVKFYGSVRTEEVPEAMRGREFYRAPVWKRALTVAAGPVANFLLAILAYTSMGMYGIAHPPPVVGEVMPGGPADRAGLRFEDVIKEINGETITTWSDLQTIISSAAGKELNLVVEREGQPVNVTLVPESVKDDELIGRETRGQIGISPGHVPAIVTVTDANGWAAKAGLATGDRVKRLVIGERSVEVKYWRQLIRELTQAARDGVTSVELTYVRPNADANAKGGGKDEGAEQKVSLDFAAVGVDSSVSPDQLAAKLGIADSQLTIATVKEDAAKFLEPGDRIVSYAGAPVSNVFQFRDASLDAAGQKPVVPITVERAGEERVVEVPLKAVDVQKAEGRVTMYTLPASFLGQLEQTDVVIQKYSNPFEALWFGIKETGIQTGMVAVAVGGLFTGDMPLEALGGPISIAKVASDSVRLGWQTFLTALALISVNLGLLNLFPIPVLDGGQLVLLGAEALRRRPLTDVALENFQKVGFVMVLALVAMATYNDLSRFWASMLEGVIGFFQ